ncbi:MAG: hypothetical protein ABL963_04555 [Longimicrobiales bacterium]
MSVLIARLAAALLLMSGMASIARAQTSREFGIDSQFSVPVATYPRLWPSFDYVLVNPGPFSIRNGDLRYRIVTESIDWLFVGGGLNRARRFIDSRGGLDLYAGIEFLSGRVHRFGELRFNANDESSARASVGLNVMLGPS